MAEEERGMLERAWDFVKERIAAIPKEVGDMVDHKAAQGASELARGLFSESNAYEPYGYGAAPLQPQEPAVNFEDHLNNYISQASPKQDQEKGLER